MSSPDSFEANSRALVGLGNQPPLTPDTVSCRRTMEGKADLSETTTSSGFIGGELFVYSVADTSVVGRRELLTVAPADSWRHATSASWWQVSSDESWGADSISHCNSPSPEREVS